MRNLYRRIGTTWVVAALLLPSTTMAQTAPPVRIHVAWANTSM
jgi:hypothetical protein